MIRQRVSFAVAGAIVASTALTVGLATPANAVGSDYDPGFVPTAADLVGVGSDTIEIALDYLSKGHDGIQGYNDNPAKSFDIASWAAAEPGGPSTISLREGHPAVTRPNGSGPGKQALYGPSNNPDVNFARASSSLNAAEAGANLQQFAFAVDGLKLAVSSTATNAPASISAAELVKIYDGTYDTWSDLPGYAGPAPAAQIKPLIPQGGSGTRSFFEGQLAAANGGAAVVITGATETQEHSDADVKNDPNAIVPFSTARAKSLTSTVKLTKGFKAYRAVYNVVRQSDLADATLGPKLTDVFSTTGFICSPEGKLLIEAAGFDQLATPANGGVCGVPTQEAVSTFVTTGQVDTDTSLVAESLNTNKVRLTANVDAASTPEGTIVFTEDGTAIGTPVEVVNGAAVKNLTLVSAGDHSYSADFVPDAIGAFTPSTSGPVTTSVKTASTITAGLLNASGTYGSTRLLAVGATVDGDAAAGSISVKVDNGTPVTVPLIGGAAFYTVPGNLAVGTHSVTATLAGTATTTEAARTVSLTVKKAATKASFKFAKAKIKAKTTPKVTVSVVINGASSSVRANGKVTLKYGSKIVGTGTVKNGVAKVNLKKFKKKKSAYSVKATFTSSSANYSNSPASAAVKITVS